MKKAKRHELFTKMVTVVGTIAMVTSMAPSSLTRALAAEPQGAATTFASTESQSFSPVVATTDSSASADTQTSTDSTTQATSSEATLPGFASSDDITTDTGSTDALATMGSASDNTDDVAQPFWAKPLTKDVTTVDDPATSIENDQVMPGDVLNYKVTYRNSTDAKQTVTITDNAPDYTTYVTGSASDSGSESGGVVTWTVDVKAGETKTVSFQVKVIDTANAEFIENTAHATEGTNNYTTNTTDNFVTPLKKDVQDATDLATSINGNSVYPGETLNYTVSWTNGTSGPATPTLTDVVPDGTTYVPGSMKVDTAGYTATTDGTGTSDDPFSWAFATAIPAGATVTVSFQVTVNDDVTAGTTITNQAKEGANESNTTSNAVSPLSKDVTMAKAPDVSIDDNAVVGGETLHYKVTYTNTETTAQTVTITDDIPAQTTYVKDSVSAYGTYANETVTWKNVTVPVNSSATFTFDVKVDDDAVSSLITNQATSGANKSNITKNPVIPLKKEVLDADGASIDDQQVKAGDTLTYTLTYTNTTIVDEPVEFEDALPANTTFVSADNDGSYDKGTGKVTWPSITIPAYTSATVSFKVTVDGAAAGSTLENAGKATNSTGEITSNTTHNPVNPLKKDVTNADGASIDGQQVTAGDTLTYKVSYTNATDGVADVTMTDVVPTGTTYVSGSADNGGTEAGGTVTWDLTVAKGTTATVTFKVTVDKAAAGTTLSNTASDGTNDSNAVTNPVGPLTKDVLDASGTSIDGDEVKAGDTLTYKDSYANSTDAAQNVTITDTIPENTTYVEGSVDNGGIYDAASRTITWNLTLAAGVTKTVSFQVTVDKAAAGSTLESTASDGANASNSTENPVSPLVKDVLVSGSTVNGKTVTAGETLTYKISYTNTTATDASVTLTDTLPAHTTYVDGSATDSGSHAAGGVTWKLTLAAGATKTVSFQVTVDEAAGGSTLRNTAGASDGTDDYSSNTTQNPVAKVVIDKSLVSTDGTTATYTLTVKNTGDVALPAGYQVTDSAVNLTYRSFVPSSDGVTYKGGVFTMPSIAAGESVALTVTYDVVDSSTSIVNHAFPTTPPRDADYTLTKTRCDKDGNAIDDTTLSVGDTIYYKVTVKNDDADSALSSITVTDTVSDNLTITSTTGGTLADGAVTWETGEVKASGETSIIITATVDSVGDGHASSVASAPNHKVIVTDLLPSMAVTKTQSPEGTVKAGDTITYTLTLANTGKVVASGIALRDYIPANTTYVADSAVAASGIEGASVVFTGLHAQGQIDWFIPKLAVGATTTMTFQVTVDEGTPSDTVVSNTALFGITGGNDLLDPTDPDPGVASNTVQTTVTGKAVPDVTPDGTSVPRSSANSLGSTGSGTTTTGVPETADETPTLPIALLALSGLAVVALALRKRHLGENGA